MALASVPISRWVQAGHPAQLAGERMGKVRGAAAHKEKPVGVDDGLVKASAQGKLVGERGAQGKHRLDAAEERTQRHEQHKDEQQGCKPQRRAQSAAHQEVSYLTGVVPHMTLIGQVETSYLKDGEEQGYAEAFCQRGDGHDDHGGDQLPAGNLDQAGDVLQEGPFGRRGESPLSPLGPLLLGSGFAAGDWHGSNDSRGRVRWRLSTWAR